MVKLIPDVFCDVTEVIIYTKDYSGLFTTVTGAMSASGTYIYDAKIYTSVSGWAIDHFRIQDTHSKSITDESYLQRISDNIQKAVKNHKIDFSQDKKNNLKHIKQSKDIFHVLSLVVFDNTGSSNNTIIEIETQNRYFLLYDIAHLLHQLNISIISAHINSYGEKAIDVFYIRDKFGFKIEDKKMIESLKQKILNCLNNTNLNNH
jgi:[protein-PII] uridylyltransferase